MFIAWFNLLNILSDCASSEEDCEQWRDSDERGSHSLVQCKESFFGNCLLDAIEGSSEQWLLPWLREWHRLDADLDRVERMSDDDSARAADTSSYEIQKHVRHSATSGFEMEEVYEFLKEIIRDRER